MKDIHSQLCNSHHSISASFYKVHDNKTMLPDLSAQMKNKIKKKVHNMIVLASPTNVLEILKQVRAETTRYLHNTVRGMTHATVINM